MDFPIEQKSQDEIEALQMAFILKHGDHYDGVISDKEFDRLFDSLADVLRLHGSFSETSGDRDYDFKGYRYCDQISLIGLILGDRLTPCQVAKAGLDAVAKSHRPLMIAFDHHLGLIVAASPGHLYTTQALSAFKV